MKLTQIKQTIYELFGLGSNQVRAVRCLIVTEHGKVITSNLKAVSGYLLDNELHQAFLLDHDSEVPIRNSEKHVLILDERDAYPWIGGRRDRAKRDEWAKTIDGIASNEWARQKSLYDERVARDKNIRIILLIFAVVAIILTLIIIIAFFYRQFIA